VRERSIRPYPCVAAWAPYWALWEGSITSCGYVISSNGLRPSPESEVLAVLAIYIAWYGKVTAVWV